MGSDGARASLIGCGRELVDLVQGLPGLPEPVKRWAVDEPTDFGATVQRALEFARETPVGELAGELAGNRPESWAETVLDAIAIVERDASAEIVALQDQLARLERGGQTSGGLSQAFLAAVLVANAGFSLVSPVALLEAIPISAHVAVGAQLMGDVGALYAGVVTLYGKATRQ